MSSSICPSCCSGTLGGTWHILAQQLWVGRRVTCRLRLFIHFCFPTHNHRRGHTLQIPHLQDGLGSKQETSFYLVNPWDFKVLFVVAGRTIYPDTSWNSHPHTRLCDFNAVWSLNVDLKLPDGWTDHQQLSVEGTWPSKRRCLHRNHLWNPYGPGPSYRMWSDKKEKDTA